MSKELDSLIMEFDQGFGQIPFTETIYAEYNQLLKDLECDEDLRRLMDRQKEIQLIIMNLTSLRKKDFVEKYKQELDEIDLAIDTNSKIIRINQLKYQIELEQDYLKNKIKQWKENNGFKN